MMTEGEFAEVFAQKVAGALPLGWEISWLDIGEVTVKTDTGQLFHLSIFISDDES